MKSSSADRSSLSLRHARLEDQAEVATMVNRQQLITNTEMTEDLGRYGAEAKVPQFAHWRNRDEF